MHGMWVGIALTVYAGCLGLHASDRLCTVHVFFEQACCMAWRHWNDELSKKAAGNAAVDSTSHS